jgi:hypothetical protein
MSFDPSPSAASSYLRADNGPVALGLQCVLTVGHTPNAANRETHRWPRLRAPSGQRYPSGASAPNRRRNRAAFQEFPEYSETFEGTADGAVGDHA